MKNNTKEFSIHDFLEREDAVNQNPISPDDDADGDLNPYEALEERFKEAEEKGYYWRS
jgi:hypothetical protein